MPRFISPILFIMYMQLFPTVFILFNLCTVIVRYYASLVQYLLLFWMEISLGISNNRTVHNEGLYDDTEFVG